MEITLEQLRHIIKIVKEGPIEGGMDGTGVGVHHVQSGIRMHRGRGPERERRVASGQDTQIDEVDADVGADMYTLTTTLDDVPERIARGHAKTPRTVDDPGHPIYIYEEDFYVTITYL